MDLLPIQLKYIVPINIKIFSYFNGRSFTNRDLVVDDAGIMSAANTYVFGDFLLSHGFFQNKR